MFIVGERAAMVAVLWYLVRGQVVAKKFQAAKGKSSLSERRS